jgi:hypothetical protein
VDWTNKKREKKRKENMIVRKRNRGWKVEGVGGQGRPSPKTVLLGEEVIAILTETSSLTTP